MADKYIDRDYLSALMGADAVDAMLVAGRSDVDQQIAAATALIQSYLRNNGYSTPATTTDETVKLAVCGAMWQLLSSVPSVSVKLPENWEAHPAYIAYTGILSGDATITHELNTTTAVGGSEFSQDRVTSSAQSRPARASRDQLTGY